MEKIETLESIPKIDYSRIENPIVERIFRKYDEFSQQATLDNVRNICGHRAHSDHHKSGGGGCYLTTACVDAMSLPDNCLELSVLRNFRDKILMPTSKGRKSVGEYCRIAPEIVQSVNEGEDAQNIWQSTYKDIRHAVSLVLSGNFEGAFEHYQQMTSKLRDKYLD